MKEDFCTGFPEYWYQWYISKYYVPMIRRVYIGDCCEIHDEECSTKAFIKCLRKNNVVGRYVITFVASMACLLKYGKV